MSLPKYPEYKESGVEWLGAVPCQWEVAPLKRNLRLITDRATTKRRAIALENIEGWSGRYIESEGEFQGDGTSFEPDDLLFGKLRPYLAKVLLADFSGEAVGDFHVLRPSNNLIPRFAQYQMLQREFISVVDGSTFGSKMPRAGWEALGGMPFVVPPVSEQVQIASFLDHETAKIDALIAEQEKLLALLAEKRQATISHAVTKGLDPDAPMKDSGIPWLGEVPGHWEVSPLKYISRIGNGSTPNRDNPDYWCDSGFPWLNSAVVNQDEVSEAERFVTELALKECHLPVITPPAVLVGITGQGKTRGMAAPLMLKATINQHLAYILPNPGQLEVDYLLRALEMAYDTLRTDSESAGSTKGAITCDQLSRFTIPLPPLEEQVAVAKHVDIKATHFEKLSSDSRHAIALLKERRNALIAAVVTGKVDVRSSSLEF